MWLERGTACEANLAAVTGPGTTHDWFRDVQGQQHTVRSEWSKVITVSTHQAAGIQRSDPINILWKLDRTVVTVGVYTSHRTLYADTFMLRSTAGREGGEHICCSSSLLRATHQDV